MPLDQHFPPELLGGAIIFEFDGWTEQVLVRKCALMFEFW